MPVIDIEAVFIMPEKFGSLKLKGKPVSPRRPKEKKRSNRRTKKIPK